MAKRKSLSTEEDDPKQQSKSKKLKTEGSDVEQDDSGNEAPLKTTKSSKPSVKTEDTDDGVAVVVQSTAEGEKYIDLGKNKRATVRSFKNNRLIDIREYYSDKASGEQKPGKKGISLSLDQWAELQRVAPKLDELAKQVK